MRTLTLRAYAFFAALIVGAGASVAVIILQTPNAKLIVFMLLSTTLVLGFLFEKMRKRIADARLIIENQILHIQPAIIYRQGGKKAGHFSCDSIEVFVSCFGILLESKIIKFNQDGIRLKGVELSRDFIYLTYGTTKKLQSIKLLHAAIDESQLAEISRKFRYETGVEAMIQS